MEDGKWRPGTLPQSIVFSKVIPVSPVASKSRSRARSSIKTASGPRFRWARGDRDPTFRVGLPPDQAASSPPLNVINSKANLQKTIAHRPFARDEAWMHAGRPKLRARHRDEI